VTVEEPHAPAVLQQAVGDVGGDESGTAGDQREAIRGHTPHTVSPRVASCRLASATRSSAV
jgi:hypothetical protein